MSPGTMPSGAAPIVLAALGETISEKAGVINLSLDGSILRKRSQAPHLHAIRATSIADYSWSP